MRRWNTDERGAIEASMKSVYTQFVARVAEGRKLKPADVEPIAQGRVGIGADAKQRVLVDQLGGLDDALADARKRGGLAADAPVDVYPPTPTLGDLVESFAGEVTMGPLGERERLLGADAARVVRRTVATILSFRRCTVQT